MVKRLVSVDSETLQLPDAVRDVLAANLSDAGTPEGAAVAAAAGGGGGGGTGLVEDATDPGFFLTTGGTAPTNFAPSVTLGVSQADLTVTASFTGTDPDDDPLTYVVDWGDGSTTDPATSPAVHAYATAGTYTITVTVSDGALTGTDSVEVTVTAPAGPAFGTVVLSDGPVSAFLFQETTPPSVDSLGVMTATTALGEVAVGQNQPVGTVLRSVYFGATATYVNLTPNSAVMDGWTAYTIEALIRPDRTTTSRYLLAKDDSTTNRAYRLGHNASGKIQFGHHGAGSSTASITGATTMVDNADYHVVVTFDGTTVRLYLNGVEDGSGARTGAVPTIAAPHKLGWRISGEYYRGWLAGLAFYNKVLTPAEIQEHASAAGLLA